MEPKNIKISGSIGISSASFKRCILYENMLLLFITYFSIHDIHKIMTNNAQFQHLSNGLNDAIRKIETLTRNIATISSKLEELELAGKPKPEEPVVLPDKYYTRLHHISGPDTVTLDISLDMAVMDRRIMFVTMVGGGGAGSPGSVGGGILRSGAGGGAGESIVSRAIDLSYCTGKLYITAGAGGSADRINGSDSSLECETRDGTRLVVIAKGGAGAVVQDGGAGMVSEINPAFNGGSGTNGDSQALNGPIFVRGGDGGGSYFAPGGKGGYTYFVKDAMGKTVPNPKGQDGECGSGGGGSISGLQSTMVGVGGHGFVKIEYASL
jgi:hypothetical protein